MKMKKILAGILVSALALTTAAFPAAGAESVKASGICGENVKWELSDDGKMTIFGTGEIKSYVFEGPVEGNMELNLHTDVNSLVIEEGVTSIGEAVFGDFNGLKTVELPESLNSIGAYAFFRCSNLESIKVPNSECTLSGGYTICSETDYDDDTGYIYDFSGTIYGVEGSNAQAYAEKFNYKFEAIDGSENKEPEIQFEIITDLLSYAEIDSDNDDVMDSIKITGCKSSFESGEIPSEIDGLPVTIIGSGAFNDSSYLRSIKLPDTLKEIGNKAFFYCECLNNVYMPNSVTKIGAEAFAYCRNLKKINIPDSVTEFGEQAFYCCESIESITIPSNITDTGISTFSGCVNVTSITIPNGVVTIGASSFGSTAIKNITIPDSVKEIGGGAFYRCVNLENALIPDSVESIGSGAFGECDSLKNVKLGKSVKDIHEKAFDCNLVENFIVSEDNRYYTSEDGVLFNKDKTHLVTYNGGNKRGTYIVPDTVKTLGKYAFYFSPVVDVELPESVESIGECAFIDCYNLKSITVFNPDCKMGTICNSQGVDNDYYYGVIYGQKNSTAQTYAEEHEFTFALIEDRPPAFVQGDISGNGKIDLYDAIEIAKSLIGTRKFTDEEKQIADFNGDGKVDLYDAIAIAKYLLNK